MEKNHMDSMLRNFWSEEDLGGLKDMSSCKRHQKKKVPDVLPPCRVCGDTASGLHYGVNTCEACKRFFKRSFNRRIVYRCSTGNWNCTVNLSKRASCTGCRYQKCITVGMSKEAIKMGRTTAHDKNRYIQEVKSLQDVKTKVQHDVSNHSNEYLAQLVQEIVAAYKELIPYNPESTVVQKETEFLWNRTQWTEIFGRMEPLSYHDYMPLLAETGVDIDGRREVFRKLYPTFETSIRQIVKFSKSIPMFKDLPLADKVALVKYRFTEVYVLWDAKSFNVEKGLWTLMWGEVLEFEWVKQFFYDIDFFQGLINIMHRIRQIDLTFEETILMGCISLVSSDKDNLANPETVDNMQQLLVDSLHFLLAQRMEKPGPTLGRCIAVLTDMRTFSYETDKEVEKSLNKWMQANVTVPPLLFEVWKEEANLP